jgi:hypothetical protein
MFYYSNDLENEVKEKIFQILGCYKL